MKTLVILALAGMMSMANAQAPGRGGPGPGEGRDMKAMLGLDDATASKVEKLRDDHQKNVIALRAKMKTTRVDFQSMMRKDNPDESALLAKQKELSALKGELQESMLKHRLAVAKLLTPEQQKLMREHRGAGIYSEGGKGRPGRMMDGRHGRSSMKHHRGSGRGESCCR
jgi:Spy/CpxP family protein refolding chaperone